MTYIVVDIGTKTIGHLFPFDKYRFQRTHQSWYRKTNHFTNNPFLSRYSTIRRNQFNLIQDGARVTSRVTDHDI